MTRRRQCMKDYEPCMALHDIQPIVITTNILLFSYTPDTLAYTRSQTPSERMIKKHPRRGKFRSLPNDLFNGIQKVPLRRHLPPGTYSKHTRLQNHQNEALAHGFLAYLSCYRSQLRSRCVRAQTSNQIKPNVPFNAHATSINGQQCDILW